MLVTKHENDTALNVLQSLNMHRDNLIHTYDCIATYPELCDVNNSVYDAITTLLTAIQKTHHIVWSYKKQMLYANRAIEAMECANMVKLD